jgi:hypothetical protein
MEILHARTILKIDAGGVQARDAGNYRRHVIAQQLPLLTIKVFLPVTGFRTCGPGIDGADAVRMGVWKISQKESVDDGKYRRVRANGKRQHKGHGHGETGIVPQLARCKLKVFASKRPSPILLARQQRFLQGNAIYPPFDVPEEVPFAPDDSPCWSAISAARKSTRSTGRLRMRCLPQGGRTSVSVSHSEAPKVPLFRAPVSSLLAQQYHRINRQRASRWNPRSQ